MQQRAPRPLLVLYQVAVRLCDFVGSRASVLQYGLGGCPAPSPVQVCDDHARLLHGEIRRIGHYGGVRCGHEYVHGGGPPSAKRGSERNASSAAAFFAGRRGLRLTAQGEAVRLDGRSGDICGDNAVGVKALNLREHRGRGYLRGRIPGQQRGD